MLIIMKQATALTILSALTCILKTAEVALAICNKEQVVVEKMIVIKKRFL